MLLNICEDLKIKILTDHFSFRELMMLRVVSKTLKMTIDNNNKFWTIINMTDISTAPIAQLEEQFLHDSYSYIYRLSSKAQMASEFMIPSSLKICMINNKLLII